MKTARNSLTFKALALPQNLARCFSPVRFFLLILAGLSSCGRVSAQSSGVPLGMPTYYLLERLSVTNRVDGRLHPEIKAWSRRDVAELAMAIDSAARNLSQRDGQILQYLLDDNNEWAVSNSGGANEIQKKYLDESRTFYSFGGGAGQHGARTNSRPLLGVFWRSPANFLEVNHRHFRLRANPLLNFTFQRWAQDSSYLFANQRGVEVRGDVDGRVFFYTNFLETQARFPDYVQNWVTERKAVPGNGLYKRFDSKFFDIEKGFDFNNAVAYVGFPVSRHVGVQLGHGKHFIGNGYRSMFLSDFSNNYFYLRLNTRVWKFDYQNLFMEITPSTANAEPGDKLLPKKFAAMHYLNFRPARGLAVGFFEATVFNRSQDFELQYLNPIILYRTVETNLGSPDNVLIGLDFRWNFLRRFQLYGQAMLDEFNFKYLYKPEERGWRGNKNGVQAGLKWFNALEIKHLDLQVEYNAVRPYTYSHADTLNSYTHYHQPLAHPLGANFSEWVGIARYMPHAKVMLQARYIRSEYGENANGQNWGGDPLLSNHDFVQQYGNEIGQGIKAKQSIVGAELNWQFYHNMFLDLRYFLREKDSADDARDLKTTLYGVGLRLNVNNPNFDF